MAPDPWTSTDPAVLASAARRVAARCRKEACHLAGLAGRWAAVNGRPLDDNPFDDDHLDLQERWHRWHTVATAAKAERAAEATADLLVDFTPHPQPRKDR